MNTETTAYQKVAQKCQEFAPCEKCDSCSNSSSETNPVSCLNCEHFSSTQHCNLDLYDKIIRGI
ncbi:MAG: hypothetical protein RR056_05235 [Acetivibrio sp.]